MYIKFCFGFGIVFLGVGGNLKGAVGCARQRETERPKDAF